MKLIIIYGSANDMSFMEPGREYLDQHHLTYEEKVLSVHRNHDELMGYLERQNSDAEKKVFICVAGLAAALPGLVSVKVKSPVIGVPVPGGPLNGIDALLTIVQSPGEVPVLSVGLHKKAPLNACMAAHRILNL